MVKNYDYFSKYHMLSCFITLSNILMILKCIYFVQTHKSNCLLDVFTWMNIYQSQHVQNWKKKSYDSVLPSNSSMRWVKHPEVIVPSFCQKPMFKSISQSYRHSLQLCHETIAFYHPYCYHTCPHFVIYHLNYCSSLIKDEPALVLDI